MAHRRCLLLFTKPSRPGRVKTRLIGALDARQAAELHQAFVDDLLDRLGRGRFDLWLAWALDEGEAAPTSDQPAVRQRGADLGRRLFHGLHEASRRYPWVMAVGSDHPELPLETVHRAFELLEAGADVVLGPASDGGYYLIGVSAAKLNASLFRNVPWSTDGVLEATLERCRELGLSVELVERGHDVDTPQDLRRLVDQLRKSDLNCPRTRALLAGWNRLSVA